MTMTNQIVEHLKTCDMRRARLPLVADTLGVPETTLRRRLAIEGNRFSDLVKAERMRRVQEMPDAGCDHLSVICGYADKQGFSRAFRALFGQNYRDFRRELSV